MNDIYSLNNFDKNDDVKLLDNAIVSHNPDEFKNEKAAIELIRKRFQLIQREKEVFDRLPISIEVSDENKLSRTEKMEKDREVLESSGVSIAEFVHNNPIRKNIEKLPQRRVRNSNISEPMRQIIKLDLITEYSSYTIKWLHRVPKKLDNFPFDPPLPIFGKSHKFKWSTHCLLAEWYNTHAKLHHNILGHTFLYLMARCDSHDVVEMDSNQEENNELITEDEAYDQDLEPFEPYEDEHGYIDYGTERYPNADIKDVTYISKRQPTDKNHSVSIDQNTIKIFYNSYLYLVSRIFYPKVRKVCVTVNRIYTWPEIPFASTSITNPPSIIQFTLSKRLVTLRYLYDDFDAD